MDYFSFFNKKAIILKITDIICLLGTNIKNLNKKYEVDVDKNGCYFLLPPKGIKRRIICITNSSGNIISIDFGYMRCNFLKKINKLQKHKKLTHNVVLEEYYRGAYSHGWKISLNEDKKTTYHWKDSNYNYFGVPSLIFRQRKWHGIYGDELGVKYFMFFE